MPFPPPIPHSTAPSSLNTSNNHLTQATSRTTSTLNLNLRRRRHRRLRGRKMQDPIVQPGLDLILLNRAGEMERAMELAKPPLGNQIPDLRLLLCAVTWPMHEGSVGIEDFSEAGYFGLGFMGGRRLWGIGSGGWTGGRGAVRSRGSVG